MFHVPHATREDHPGKVMTMPRVLMTQDARAYTCQLNGQTMKWTRREDPQNVARRPNNWPPPRVVSSWPSEGYDAGQPEGAVLRPVVCGSSLPTCNRLQEALYGELEFEYAVDAVL